MRVIVVIILLFAIQVCQGNPKIVIEKKHFSSKSSKYEIKIEIPKLVDLRADIINRDVQQFIDSIIVSFQNECSKANEDQFVFNSKLSHNLIIDIANYYSDGKIVSYCFSVSRYYSGNVHDYLWYKTFNYSLNEKKYLKPKDIISAPDSIVRRVILKKLMKEADCNWEGNLENVSINDIKMNVTKNNIVFNFSNYEIESYACGAPRIKIPKKIFYCPSRTTPYRRVGTYVP